MKKQARDRFAHSAEFSQSFSELLMNKRTYGCTYEQTRFYHFCIILKLRTTKIVYFDFEIAKAPRRQGAYYSESELSFPVPVPVCMYKTGERSAYAERG